MTKHRYFLFINCIMFMQCHSFISPAHTHTTLATQYLPLWVWILTVASRISDLPPHKHTPARRFSLGLDDDTMENGVMWFSYERECTSHPGTNFICGHSRTSIAHSQNHAPTRSLEHEAIYIYLSIYIHIYSRVQ